VRRLFIANFIKPIADRSYQISCQGSEEKPELLKKLALAVCPWLRGCGTTAHRLFHRFCGLTQLMSSTRLMAIATVLSSSLANPAIAARSISLLRAAHRIPGNVSSAPQGME